MPVPTVTQIHPNAGTPSGGTIVSLVGTNFTGTTGVTMNGVAATGVTVNSATSITLTTPANTGTGHTLVTNGTGTSTGTSADNYTFVLPVPSDPSASANTVSLFNFLYKLSFPQTGGPGTPSAPLHLLSQTLSGQDLFDAILNNGSPTKEFDQWKLTATKTPAVMDIAVDYCNDVSAITSYNAQGVCTIDWTVFQAALEAHARNGGIVEVQNSLRNIPTQYVASTTYSGSTSTIGAINTATTMTVASGTGFPVGGGNGKIVAQDSPNPTCHQFTYTSRSGTTLSGVVISGTGSLAVNNGANVFLAQLLPSRTNFMTAGESAGVYPLQYSSTAYTSLPGAGSNTLGGCSYNNTTTITTTGSTATMPVVKGMYVTGTGIPANATVATVAAGGLTFTISSAATGGAHSAQTLTFTLGQSTDYAASLLEDANANLNAMLDQVVTGLHALGSLGISVIFRHLNEANASNQNWFHFEGASGNCYWWAYLWVYCWGYITGNAVFSGQPVSATPCHNLLFPHAPIASTTTDVILNPPTINGVTYCDIIGVDQYTNPPNLFASLTNAIALLPGMGALPRAFCEVFGGSNATAANIFPTGYLDAATYGSGTVDLNTLASAGNLVLVVPPDLPTFYAQSYQPFAASGVVWIPTAKGLFAVNYSSVTNAGALPCTLTLSGGVGSIPVQSFIVSKNVVSQPVSITTNNCGTTTWITDTSGRNSYYMTWWGNLNQQFADPGNNGAGAGTIMAAPTVNLESLPTYFAVPWKGGGSNMLLVMQ